MYGFSGAKGGGSSSFKQRPDTLRSTDTFEGLLGLCAGPIKGLTRGFKSLKIDGTPLEDESGKLNFENFVATFADGDPSAFPQQVDLRLGAGGSPVAVGLALSNTNTSGPGPWIVKSVANEGADFLDLRFLVNQLYRQTKDGIYEHTANLEIQMKPTGAVSWISPMLGTPSQTYNQNGAASPFLGIMYLIARGAYDALGNYRAESNLGYFRIYGKTTSVAVHELRISVPNTGLYANRGWDVRARLIERENVENDPNFEKRTITWESVSAGYNTKLGVTEPWRGLSWLQIYGKASDQLTGVPEVEGECDTLIVPVPPAGVFDPETRAYTGAIWDGSWARSFTTDPAWNINGLLQDGLHGMASVSPGARLNKWDALEASKWFSELVPDGAGGLEPRSSLNLAINEPQKAAEFVPYLAGAVGALAWEENGGEWRLKVDKPETPTDIFTLEAIEGEFQYSHTNVDVRFNDITVVFRNKEFWYREDRARVVDSAHIARFGRKPTTIVLIGCTGRQEALRRAIMRLRVSTRETRQVTFTTNRRGRLVQPLSIILISDGDLGTLIGTDENTRSTGRIVGISGDRKQVTVRDPLRLELGVAYALNFTIPNPEYAPDADVDAQGANTSQPTITETISVTNTAPQRGNVTTLHLASSLPAAVAPNANVALSAPSLPAIPKQYRVTNVQIDGEKVAVSAIEIDTGKWAASDAGEAEEGYVPPADAVVPPVLDAVITTGSFTSDYQSNLTLNVNWNRPTGSNIAGYRTEYRINGGTWRTINPRTSLTSIETINPQFGKWEYRITTLDRMERTSDPVILDIIVDENLKPGFYADGTPIDGLRPAEPDATDGATAGENLKDSEGNVLDDDDVITSEGTAKDVDHIGGIPTATFKAGVAQAQADIADLIDTYGNTVSSSAAMAAAEDARDQAISAANAADGHADFAETKRNEAEGFMQAAAGSAITANERAIAANASAVAASDFESSAATSAIVSAALARTKGLTPNAEFQGGKDQWSAWHTPPDAPTAANWVPTHEGATGVLVGTGGVLRYVYSALAPIDPSRKYRIRGRVWSSGHGGTIYIGYSCQDAAGAAIGTNGGHVYVAGWSNTTRAAGWHEIVSPVLSGEGTVDAASANGFRLGTKQVRICAFLNYNSNPDQVWALDSLWIEDVTSEETAAVQAGIAATQAATATAQAAVATEQKNLAASHTAAAQRAAQATLPSTFEDGALYFKGDHLAAAPGNATYGTDATYGPYVANNSAAVNSYIATKGRLPSFLGKRWKIRALLQHISGTVGNVALLLEYWNAASGGGNRVTYQSANVAAPDGAPDWVELTFTTNNAAPFINPELVFNNGLAAVRRCYALEIIDVDALEAATLQAGIAASQAAIATAQAAAAQTSAELAASIGGNAENPDPGFDVYPAGGLPTKWTAVGMTTADTTRVSDPRGGFAPRSVLTAGTAVRWFQQTGTTNAYRPGTWLVLSGEVTLDAGTFSQSGIMLRLRAGSSTAADLKLDFKIDADVTGTVPGAGVAGRKYTYSKLVQVPSGSTASDNFLLYAFLANSNMSGSLTNMTATIWHVAFRFATPAEIATGTVLPDLQATQITQGSVLATHTTRLASWLTSTSAGAGFAKIEMNALDINGNAASEIEIVADRVSLGSLSGVLTISGGKATFGTDVYVNSGKIVVDTGTHMKVIGNGFGTSNQFIEWFGPKMALNLCSEANALAYTKKTGDAYFGGTLLAGALKNGATTSSTATNAVADTGTFGSNGNNIVVTCSWTYTSVVTTTYAHNQFSAFAALAADYDATGGGQGAFYSGTKSWAVSPATTLTLARKVGAGSFANVQSASVSSRTTYFEGQAPQLGDQGGQATITTTATASFTYTDTTQSANDRQFTATLNRTFSDSGTVTQRISIQTVEE